jgi:hypothetical protein
MDKNNSSNNLNNLEEIQDPELIKFFKERKMNFRYVTDEETKAEEDEVDEYHLKNEIKINNVLIKKYGELRPYIKSTNDIELLEDIMDDDDYIYFYKWILWKEIQEENKKSNL